MTKPRPPRYRLAPDIESQVAMGRRLTEDELFRAKAVSVPPEPERRPLAPVIDENGFLHGEPISRGRTAETGDQG